VSKPRRFPPPWTVDEMNDACFIVRDKNGQRLFYFYFENEPGRRVAANLLTKDGAAAGGQLRQATGAVASAVASRTPGGRCAKRRTGYGRQPRPGLTEAHRARRCDPCDCGGDLLRRARCCAGTDFGPNCHYSNPVTFDSRHFNYDQLHDVLQFSGGELSNRLFHSRAARGHARRNCDLEPDGKHGVRDGLHFEPARVSDHMRERLPVPIGSPLTLRGRRTSLAASGRIIPAPPPKNSRL
jgi:hypothetical protein